MDTDIEPLSDDLMWSGINSSVELKKSGVNMNLFEEDVMVSYERSPLQTVPEGNINPVFSDFSVPQDIPQDIKNPKYYNLRNVNTTFDGHQGFPLQDLPSHEFPSQDPGFASQHNGSAPGSFHWESAPTEEFGPIYLNVPRNEIVPTVEELTQQFDVSLVAQDTLDWHQGFPLQDLPSHEFPSQDPGFASQHNGSAPGSFHWESAPTEEFGPIYPDVSLVAKRLDPALFDNYQPQEPVQSVSFGKIKVVAPPARYNKKRVVAEKKAPAPISRRGRGTKDDGQRNSVQRHRDNIKNYLQTAPAYIDELTAVEEKMQKRVHELEHIRRELNMLFQWNQ